jgi:hypothetical protein
MIGSTHTHRRQAMDEATWRRAVVQQVARGVTHWNALRAVANPCNGQEDAWTRRPRSHGPDADKVALTPRDLLTGFERYHGNLNALRTWALAMASSGTWTMTAHDNEKGLCKMLLKAIDEVGQGRALEDTVKALVTEKSVDQ